MLQGPWGSEISQLRFASVEMTIGVYADIAISSGGACSGMEDYKTHRPLSGSDATLLHNPRRQPRPFFLTCGEAATTTLGLKGRQT